MTDPATQTHEDDVLGKAYDRKLMRRLLIYARPYRALMYGALALLCVEGGVQVVGPLLTRRVIDVAVPAHDTHVVIASTAFLFLALVAEFVTSYGQTWLTSLLGQRGCAICGWRSSSTSSGSRCRSSTGIRRAG